MDIIAAGIEKKACAPGDGRRLALKAHGWDVAVFEALHFDLQVVGIVDCFENPVPQLLLPMAIAVLVSVEK